MKHSKLPKTTTSSTENTYITLDTVKKDSIEMGGFSNPSVVEQVRNNVHSIIASVYLIFCRSHKI